MNTIIPTPYYAVIFTSIRTTGDNGYGEMANLMEELAKKHSGFLGIDSAREEVGITVSYWESLEDIKKWKSQTDHQMAQSLGKEKWYESYRVRIAKVEKDYGFNL